MRLPIFNGVSLTQGHLYDCNKAEDLIPLCMCEIGQYQAKLLQRENLVHIWGLASEARIHGIDK